MAEATDRISLSTEEQALQSRHLNFYRSLATAWGEPATAAQKHFVEVALGHAGAGTPHEFAYMKYVRFCFGRGRDRVPRTRFGAGWTRTNGSRARIGRNRAVRQRWDGVR